MKISSKRILVLQEHLASTVGLRYILKEQIVSFRNKMNNGRKLLIDVLGNSWNDMDLLLELQKELTKFKKHNAKEIVF